MQVATQLVYAICLLSSSTERIALDFLSLPRPPSRCSCNRAQMKLLCAFVFLVLFFSQELKFIEGRHLKTRTSNKFLQKELVENNSKLHVNEKSDKTVNATPMSPSSPPSPVVSEPHPSPPGHVDDFRPTAPGHSPGVGHSLQNQGNFNGLKVAHVFNGMVRFDWTSYCLVLSSTTMLKFQLYFWILLLRVRIFIWLYSFHVTIYK